MKKIKFNYNRWHFLLTVIIFYSIIYFWDFSNFNASLIFVLSILKNIYPILFLVFVLMFIFNYFSYDRLIKEHFLKLSGFKKWFLAAISGILSLGPIYVWYPILKELHKHGVSYGLLSIFLYNRAIKLALLPLLIVYFGWKYTIFLTAVMIFFSFLQGLIFDKYIFKSKINN